MCKTSYHATNEDEISISENHNILVLREDPTGWSFGVVLSDFGNFPASYCSALASETPGARSRSAHENASERPSASWPPRVRRSVVARATRSA